MGPSGLNNEGSAVCFVWFTLRRGALHEAYDPFYWYDMLLKRGPCHVIIQLPNGFTYHYVMAYSW